MPKPSIRPTLQVWMDSQGLSDTQLAARAGLSVDLVRKAKQGKKISRASALELCSALGITLNDIVDLNY